MGNWIKSCNCIGPQGDDPVCPCRMRNVRVRDGRYVEEIDHGPAVGRVDYDTTRDVTEAIIPLEIPSLTNKRMHWRERHRLMKSHRKAAMVVPKVGPPCIVKLTRVSPRKLDDDNLVASFKGLRDGIADRLGVDDGDSRVEWRYAQERNGKHKEVRVTILRMVSPIKRMVHHFNYQLKQ